MSRHLRRAGAFLLLFALAPIASAQAVEVSIPDAQATGVGESITVPINVSGFTDVGAVSLIVNYDPAVLEFVGLENTVRSGFLSNATDGTLRIAWFDASAANPLTLGSGILTDMIFTYQGGASDIAFGSGNEISNAAAEVLSATFDGGSVDLAAGSPVDLVLQGVAAEAAGEGISLPLEVENFDDVGAISVVLEYDPAVLTFDGLSNTARDGFLSNAIDGTLRIGWFDATAVTPMDFGSGTLFEIDFTYNGGTTEVTFAGNTQVSNSEAQPLVVTSTDALVSLMTGPPVTVEAGTVAGEIGATVNVPLTVSGFENVGSVSLEMMYDPEVLEFVGLENTVRDDFVSNAEDGMLRIAWFDASTEDPLTFGTGTLAEAAFVFSGDSSAVTFGDESQVTNAQAQILQASFDPGSVVIQRLPVAELDVDALDFESVRIGQSDTLQVTLSNTGEAPLEITTIRSSIPEITVEPLEGTVDPGQALELDVIFSPTAEGAVEGELTISTNAGDEPLTISLAGTGSTGVSTEEGSDLPTEYALGQNYPNPFNPATTIEYSVASAGHVRLDVLNTLGQVVRTLVDGHQVPGTYTQHVDMRDMSSGVYLYRLSAESFTRTHTMILTK